MADTVKIVGQQPGDDYTTMAAALAAIPSNIVTHGGDNWVIQIRADQNYAGFDFPWATTDASHKIIFEAFPGDEVNGAGVGAGFEGSSGGSNGFIGIPSASTNNTHIVFRGIKIIRTSGADPAIYLTDSQNIEFDSCFIKSVASVGLQLPNGGSARVTFTNCIFAECGGSSMTFGNIGSAALVTLNRCTSNDSSANGFADRKFGATGRIIIKNCLGIGNTFATFASKLDQENANVDFLASDDTSASSEAHTTGFTGRTEADFVDYANGNHSLATGSSLRGAGEAGSDIGADLEPVVGGTTVDGYYYKSLLAGGMQ